MNPLLVVKPEKGIEGDNGGGDGGL